MRAVFSRADGVARAFSILELLVVIAVVGILAALAVPALNNILAGGGITQAATMVVGQLSTARQMAVAQNQPVTVRFLRAGSDKPYQSIQLVKLDAEGNAEPASRASRFPESAALASDPALSTLLGVSGQNPPSAGNAVSGKDPAVPGLGINYSYVQFTFRPRGSTDLNPQFSGRWFVTVVPAKDAENSTAPANFATVQIDPVTGSLQIHRP